MKKKQNENDVTDPKQKITDGQIETDKKEKKKQTKKQEKQTDKLKQTKTQQNKIKLILSYQ